MEALEAVLEHIPRSMALHSRALQQQRAPAACGGASSSRLPCVVATALQRTGHVSAPAALAAGHPSRVRGFDGRSLAPSRGRIAPSVLVRAEAGRPWKARDARLVLEDGSVWLGQSFGATGTEIGEVVFNTSLTGYEEIMTDPSYKGQFVAFTCPHIGNVGINKGEPDGKRRPSKARCRRSALGPPAASRASDGGLSPHCLLPRSLPLADDNESAKCHTGAIIIRDLSTTVSNYRSRLSLDAYCKAQNVIGIAGIDTRALTKALRETGCLVGVITTDASKKDADLVAMAKAWSIEGKDLLSVVSCTQPYEWAKGTLPEWEFAPGAKEADKVPFHVRLQQLERRAGFPACTHAFHAHSSSSLSLTPSLTFLSYTLAFCCVRRLWPTTTASSTTFCAASPRTGAASRLCRPPIQPPR